VLKTLVQLDSAHLDQHVSTAMANIVG